MQLDYADYAIEGLGWPPAKGNPLLARLCRRRSHPALQGTDAVTVLRPLNPPIPDTYWGGPGQLWQASIPAPKMQPLPAANYACSRQPNSLLY